MSPPSFLAASLMVATGGGFGAWLRFLVGRGSVALLGPIAASAFPWATLTCNVAGSFAMGVLVGWLARHGSHNEPWRLLLGMGLLGGFTTFSTFSLEFALFIERGAPGQAMLYVALSLLGSFAGIFLGLMLMRAVA